MAGKKRLTSCWWRGDWSPPGRGPEQPSWPVRVLVDNQVGGQGRRPGPGFGSGGIKGGDLPFVSRGGLKLAKAIKEFGIDLRGRKVLDIGASTGWFTDCCLQAGAALVYAVDVGYGQLAWSLRTNPSSRQPERTNVRYLSGTADPRLAGFCLY